MLWAGAHSLQMSAITERGEVLPLSIDSELLYRESFNCYLSAVPNTSKKP